MYAFILVILVGSGGIGIDIPSIGPSSPGDVTFYCQYDDGLPNWLMWSGTYRGVWFHVHDFDPGSYAMGLEWSEYWFYHHSIYPWDTSEFYAEVWNPDAVQDSLIFPYQLLDRQVVTALHYGPAYSYYPPIIEAGIPPESCFWILANMEMSSGGWPSSLSDGSATTYPAPRSWWSDDFFTWNPSEPSPGDFCDYFIRTQGEGINLPLQRVTWGSIKATF
jgi:hypothetical protein